MAIVSKQLVSDLIKCMVRADMWSDKKGNGDFPKVAQRSGFLSAAGTPDEQMR